MIGNVEELKLSRPPLINFGVRSGTELARIKAAMSDVELCVVLVDEGVVYAWSGGYHGMPARVQAPLKREPSADDLRLVLRSKRGRLSGAAPDDIGNQDA